MNEPLNVCIKCKNEFIGFVDDPEIDFVCEDCKGDEE
jgi:hypothetical protein